MIPILNELNILEQLKALKNPFFETYYAFYSSWFGGIVKDPALMLIPIDDHLVHRGDGVFEAMKAVDHAVYLLDEHLERLFYSASRISLVPPFTIQKTKEIILTTLKAANRADTTIRLYVSRGPGDFSVNPYDAVSSQLYIAITKLHVPSPATYRQGVAIGKSAIPVKSSWMAQVKSCNYLQNVLMKKEAVDKNLDFVIGMDSKGNITEGATENIMMIDEHQTLIYPPLDLILKGTTMVRTCELAQAAGIKTEMKPISLADLLAAREVLITGTSLNVLPVVRFEEHLIGNGNPGPIAQRLNQLMCDDIASQKKSTRFNVT